MRGFWRHEACLDLYGDMRQKFAGPRYRKVRAIWYVRGEPLGLVQTVTIMNDLVGRWHRCSPMGDSGMTNEDLKRADDEMIAWMRELASRRAPSPPSTATTWMKAYAAGLGRAHELHAEIARLRADISRIYDAQNG